MCGCVADCGYNSVQLIRGDQALGMKPMEFLYFFFRVVGKVDPAVPIHKLFFATLPDFMYDDFKLSVMEQRDFSSVGIEIGYGGFGQGMQDKANGAGQEKDEAKQVCVAQGVKTVRHSPKKKHNATVKEGAVSFHRYPRIHANGSIGDFKRVHPVGIGAAVFEGVQLEFEADNVGETSLGDVHAVSPVRRLWMQ